MEEAKVVQRQKAFNIKKGIPLPLKVSRYKVDDSYLFIAPDKASFITTNLLGSRFIDFFKKGLSIRQVIDTLVAEGLNMDTINSELHRFLVKVEKKGFYEDSNVTDVHIEEPALHLDITNRCNLTCVHCLRDAGAAKSHELTTEEWLHVIDTFADQHVTRVCISGGEALLHKGIFDILKRAKLRGLHVTLFTNGVLIVNEAIVKRLSKYVDHMQMSLDGATREVNDKIRGKGCFDKVIRAAKWIEKTNIKLDIAISIMPQNSDDLEENLEHIARSLGPKVNLRISPSVKEGRATSQHVFQSDDLAKTKVRTIVGKMYEKHLKKASATQKNIKLNNCGFGETVVISSSGDIYPCNLYEKRVSYGNVRSDDFREAIKKINKDRRQVETDKLEKCKTCDLSIICYGGCRLNNVYKKNNLFEASCTPQFKQQLCARVIDKEENYNPVDLWIGKSSLPPYQGETKKPTEASLSH